jgi:hypothetical protein
MLAGLNGRAASCCTKDADMRVAAYCDAKTWSVHLGEVGFSGLSLEVRGSRRLRPEKELFMTCREINSYI